MGRWRVYPPRSRYANEKAPAVPMLVPRAPPLIMKQGEGTEAHRRLPVMGSVDVATRWNLSAIEDAYRRWRDDPQSVDPSWRWFFEGFELGAARAAVLA